MTVIFTPPTHNEYFAPPGGDRLWSRVPYPRGHTVLINPLWTTTPYPGLPVVDSDTLLDAQAHGYVYLGSHSYEVSADEVAALAAAGYGIHLVISDPEASAAGKGVVL